MNNFDPRYAPELGTESRFPSALLCKKLPIGVQEFAVLVAIFDHVREPGAKPFPSAVRLGLMVRLGRKTVCSVLRQLATKGLLRQIRRGKGFALDLQPLYEALRKAPDIKFPIFQPGVDWELAQKNEEQGAEIERLRAELRSRSLAAPDPRGAPVPADPPADTSLLLHIKGRETPRTDGGRAEQKRESAMKVASNEDREPPRKRPPPKAESAHMQERSEKLMEIVRRCKETPCQLSDQDFAYELGCSTAQIRGSVTSLKKKSALLSSVIYRRRSGGGGFHCTRTLTIPAEPTSGVRMQPSDSFFGKPKKNW
jgi:hypothetical protein